MIIINHESWVHGCDLQAISNCCREKSNKTKEGVSCQKPNQEQEGKTVNAKYCFDILRCLRENIRCKQSTLWHNGNLGLQFRHTSPCGTFKCTSLYLPDLAPCYFSILLKIKLKLEGCCFDTVEESLYKLWVVHAYRMGLLGSILFLAGVLGAEEQQTLFSCVHVFWCSGFLPQSRDIRISL